MSSSSGDNDDSAYTSRSLGNEEKILGAVKRYLETTYGPISSRKTQNTQNTVDEICNTIHRINTTLRTEVDRQPNHEAFPEPPAQSRRYPNLDPIVLLSQSFELERLRFGRMDMSRNLLLPVLFDNGSGWRA